MFLLIGSRAARANGINLRKDIDTCDYDIIADPALINEFVEKVDSKSIFKESKSFPNKWSILCENNGRFEYDGTFSDSNQILIKMMGTLVRASDHPENCKMYSEYLPIKTISVGNLILHVVPNFLLYLIKRSHANYPIHFEKTLHDLIKLKQYQFDPEERPYFETMFYKARKKEADERYGNSQKKINLNVPNENFFKQSKDHRILDHDSLHRIFAYRDKPMFEYVKRDLTKAKIDKDLFDALPFEDRLNMIREEVMVIGIERYFIPSGETMSQSLVYKNGFTKFLKDLCKGWCQDFALDNIDLLKTPNINFIERYLLEKSTLKVQNNA